MKFNVIINNEYIFPLFYWDGNQFQATGQLQIASDDFSQIKQSLNSITSISVVDTNNLELAHFEDFNKYISINYMGYSYSPQREEFCDQIIVTLTRSSLEQKIEELETQVENLQRQIDELKPLDESVDGAGANDEELSDEETEILEDAEEIENEYNEPTE